jgi:hypothetical protein
MAQRLHRLPQWALPDVLEANISIARALKEISSGLVTAGLESVSFRESAPRFGSNFGGCYLARSLCPRLRAAKHQGTDTAATVASETVGHSFDAAKIHRLEEALEATFVGLAAVVVRC